MEKVEKVEMVEKVEKAEKGGKEDGQKFCLVNIKINVTLKVNFLKLDV